MATLRLGSNATTQDKLLKIVYEPFVRKQFNIKALLLQIFERNEKNYAPGKEISIPMHAGQSAGYQWTNDGTLPPPSHQVIERATFVYRTLAGRIEIDDEFVEQTMGRRAADMGPLDLEMRGLITDQRTGLTFDLYGDGSGELAECVSSSAGDKVIVNHIKGLRTNMRVDILLSADGTTGPGGVTAATISVNRATKELTITAPKQLLDGSGADVNSNPTDYKVYRAGSYNKAIFGLAAAVNDANPSVANYGNVDRSDDAYDFYRSVHHEHSSPGTLRGVTDHLMQDLLDDVESHSTGSINMILMPFGVWDTLAEQLVAKKRYPGQIYKLNKWIQAIDWNGIPCVRDFFCPDTRAYFLDTSSFRLYQNNEGGWMDKDGEILSRVQGYMSYEAAWRRRLQLVCTAPGANGVLDDLEYTATS